LDSVEIDTYFSAYDSQPAANIAATRSSELLDAVL